MGNGSASDPPPSSRTRAGAPRLACLRVPSGPTTRTAGPASGPSTFSTTPAGSASAAPEMRAVRRPRARIGAMALRYWCSTGVKCDPPSRNRATAPHMVPSRVSTARSSSPKSQWWRKNSTCRRDRSTCPCVSAQVEVTPPGRWAVRRKSQPSSASYSQNAHWSSCSSPRPPPLTVPVISWVAGSTGARQNAANGTAVRSTPVAAAPKSCRSRPAAANDSRRVRARSAGIVLIREVSDRSIRSDIPETWDPRTPAVGGRKIPGSRDGRRWVPAPWLPP